MATAAPRARSLPRPDSLPTGPWAIGAFVVGLTLLSLYMRTRALGASLWMDEGLSIGISSHNFFDIPGILRQDGSPPLYYLALNLWMNVFGNGPGETQGLSVAISLLAVPGGLWAGWSLFGRRAGLICAALAAFNPFLTVYAQETRMYSLMVVLSLIGSTLFLHVFVFRRRRYIPYFIALLAALLYTHSWGIFVCAGTVVALVPLLVVAKDRKPLLKDALISYGVAGLLYLPWLPTLLYQTAHTGAPWLNKPRLGAPVQIAKGLLGGGTVTVALILAAGSGLAAIYARRISDERERTAMLTTFAIGIGTLAVAWLFSQVSPAWTTRYLGVALGPIFLLASLGLARAGRLGLVALAIVLAIWAVPKTSNLENKSNASDLAAAVQSRLHAGDMVVTLQPEQHPLIHYHLRSGLLEATELGQVKDKGIMDWRNVKTKLEDATPERNLNPLLATLARSQQVLLVHPVTSNNDDWDAPWTQLVRRRSAQWGEALEVNRCFRREGPAPDFYRRARRIGVRGVLYIKTCERT